MAETPSVQNLGGAFHSHSEDAFLPLSYEVNQIQPKELQQHCSYKSERCAARLENCAEKETGCCRSDILVDRITLLSLTIHASCLYLLIDNRSIFQILSF